MTFYVRNPEYFAHAQRHMMRKLMERSLNSERVLSFPMEMTATKDEFTLTALLPGLSEESVNLQFNNGVLTIDGEYLDASAEGVEILFSELPVGRFSRAIEINEPVVSEKIEASMKNGVLTIHLPKAEEAKPKSIKIIAK